MSRPAVRKRPTIEPLAASPPEQALGPIGSHHNDLPPPDSIRVRCLIPEAAISSATPQQESPRLQSLPIGRSPSTSGLWSTEPYPSPVPCRGSSEGRRIRSAARPADLPIGCDRIRTARLIESGLRWMPGHVPMRNKESGSGDILPLLRRASTCCWVAASSALRSVTSGEKANNQKGGLSRYPG